MSDVNIWGGTGTGGAGITVPVAVSQGGTGAVDAAGARTALAVYAKTEVDAALAAKVAQTSQVASAVLPSGTTAQRDLVGVKGYLRYNSELDTFEGFGASGWGGIGGTGGGSTGGISGAFVENSQTVIADYTITAGKNAMSAGPITINSGVTVVIPSGATWSVV